MPFSVTALGYQGILCSVGEPRWRSKDIRGVSDACWTVIPLSSQWFTVRGADAKVVASMFRRHGDKGPHHEALACTAPALRMKWIDLDKLSSMIWRTVSSVMFCDILRSCLILVVMIAGWLCDLDAKTATLVHGAHGVSAALGCNDVYYITHRYPFVFYCAFLSTCHFESFKSKLPEVVTFKTNGWRYVSMKHLGGCCELHASHRDAVDFPSSKLEVLPLVTLVLCPKVGPYNRKSGSVGVEIKHVRGFHHVSSFLYCFSGLVDSCKLSQVIDWKLDRGPRFAQGRAAHIFSICEQLLALQHWNVSCWLYVSWPFRQQQHHEHSKEKGARAVASPCSAEKSSKALGGAFFRLLSAAS